MLGNRDVSTLPVRRTAERIPASPRALPFLIAALPLVLGGTIPFTGYVNLIWGSIYGFPGRIFHEHVGAHALQIDILWILVWPAIVTWAVVLLTRRALLLSGIARYILLGLYVLSLCILVSMDGILTAAPGEDFKYHSFPLYIALLTY